jgi:hypothetical protein
VKLETDVSRDQIKEAKKGGSKYNQLITRKPHINTLQDKTIINAVIIRECTELLLKVS